METINPSKNRGFIDNILLFLWVCFAVVHLSTSMGLPSAIYRVMSYSYIVASLALPLIVIFRDKYHKHSFALLLSVFVVTLVSVVDFPDTSLDVHYFVKYLNFLCVLGAFFWGSYLRVSYATTKYIFYFNMVLTLCFIGLSFFLPKTLGLTNPNATGIVLFCTMVFNLIYFVNTRDNKYMKALGLFLTLYGLYLIYNTGARSVLIVAVILLTYTFISNKYEISRIFLAVCIIWPLFFVYFYIFLYQSELVSMDLTILDKPFFSLREIYWLSVHEKESFWLGNYVNYNNTMLHNSLFDALVQYGVFALGLMLAYLFSCLDYMRQVANTSAARRIAFMAVLCALLHGFAESAVLDGGLGFYICVGTLLAMINNSDASWDDPIRQGPLEEGPAV